MLKNLVRPTSPTFCIANLHAGVQEDDTGRHAGSVVSYASPENDIAPEEQSLGGIGEYWSPLLCMTFKGRCICVF